MCFVDREKLLRCTIDLRTELLMAIPINDIVVQVEMVVPDIVILGLLSFAFLEEIQA